MPIDPRVLNPFLPPLYPAPASQFSGQPPYGGQPQFVGPYSGIPPTGFNNYGSPYNYTPGHQQGFQTQPLYSSSTNAVPK